MITNSPPCSIFSIQQLVGLFQFTIVIICISSISPSPVLDDIPVGAFTAITGSYQPHASASRIHFSYSIGASLCKISRQGALIL